MRRHHLVTPATFVGVLAILVLAAATAACTTPQPGGTVPTAPPGATGQAGESAAGAPVAMVASGTATLAAQPEVTERARPTAALGIERVTSLEDARAKLTFALLEPQQLPENTNLTIVRLVEPREGETDPRLPGVRLIYDVDQVGVLILFQSPATGETAEGEAVSVGSAAGWLADMPDGKGQILTWEQDGVRLEMRSTGLDRDTLLAAAASVAPGGESTGG